jgi:uncharacterized protein YndB with AHSA1/START domain
VIAEFFVSDKEPTVVTFVRRFNAPRTLVFAALTHPEHLDRWAAARTFTRLTPPERAELEELWVEVQYAPGRGARYLVDSETGERLPNPSARPLARREHLLRITETFEERDGQTTWTWRGVFPEPRAQQAWLDSPDKEGLLMISQALAEYLQTFAKPPASA